mgnify:FL=1
MNNYEYIIAGLPDIAPDWKGADAAGVEAIVQEIRELCSKEDNALIDVLIAGFDGANLDLEFYQKALKAKNSFIRDYFKFDLSVRNAKVRYLNRALERPADTDIFMEAEGEFEEAQKLDAVLNQEDILSRERGMDDLMWSKIESITTFDYFDINVILGFIARLNIVARWLKLDTETGKQMFARLVEGVRGSYTGIREAADKAVGA